MDATTPSFESIPMDRVIIDTLHLFLRIGDLLINLLIMDLQRQDGVEKGKLHKFDKSKQTHLAAYEQFLNDSCWISCSWNIKDSKLTWRDLTGPEKIRLLNSINIPNLFPSLPNNDQIQHLWLTFIHWINYLKRDDGNPDELETGAKQRVRDFVRCTRQSMLLHMLTLSQCMYLNLLAHMEILASFVSKVLRN